MNIPTGALRRALAEMAQGADYAANAPHILRGMYVGAPVGAVAGGIAGAMDDDINTDALSGAVGGMALGAGAGGIAKLAHMGVGGAGGFARSLREALAARAAERGMGRAAMRAVDDADDAARFEGAGRWDAGSRMRYGEPATHTNMELRAAGQGQDISVARQQLMQQFPGSAQEIEAMSDDEIMEAIARIGGE